MTLAYMAPSPFGKQALEFPPIKIPRIKMKFPPFAKVSTNA